MRKEVIDVYSFDEKEVVFELLMDDDESAIVLTMPTKTFNYLIGNVTFAAFEIKSRKLVGSQRTDPKAEGIALEPPEGSDKAEIMWKQQYKEKYGYECQF